MTFAWPIALWLLAFPAALLAWDLVVARRTPGFNLPKVLRAVAGRRQLRTASGGARAFGRLRPRLLLVLGLATGVVALARPQWGQVEEQVVDRSREILIAVDLSRSMQVADVKPSRLDRARLLIQSLLEKLQGERVGLLLFAGTAFVQSPLSADYEILLEFLPELGPRYLPAGGSDYGRMLDAATAAFSAESTSDRFLVVLSDGEATDEGWRDRIEKLKANGVRVLGLGVGTGEGGLIPDGSGGFVKDERGAAVLSKLESATMEELARETNGAYRDASGWVDLSSLIEETIATGRVGSFVEETHIRRIERFQWLLAPAFLLLLLSYWREFPVHPRPRALRLDPAVADAVVRAGGAAVIVLAIAILASPASLRALDAIPAAPPADAAAQAAEAALSVSRLVTRLAAQKENGAADWADLARTTLGYGQTLRDLKQPVPAVPVEDALAGVADGAAQNPTAANWEQLRRDLEALLDKPPEEQPPPEEEPPPPQPQDSPQNQNQAGEPKDGEPPPDGEPQEQPDAEPKAGEGEPQPGDEKKSGEQPPAEKDAFGDMEEPPPDQDLDELPQDNSQKVGGALPKSAEEKNADPSLTMPLQRLEQLREQDSPAELFQRIDRAENPNQIPSTKDW